MPDTCADSPLLTAEEAEKLLSRVQALERRLERQKASLAHKYTCMRDSGCTKESNSIKSLKHRISQTEQHLRNKQYAYRKLGLNV